MAVKESECAWVQTHTGKWHAWPLGGLRTLCGAVNRDHLLTTPAKRIAATLPDSASMCLKCGLAIGQNATRSIEEAKRLPDPNARAWLGVLRRHLKHVYAKVAEVDLCELATRLAAVGAPTDTEAVAIFEQIRTLLLTPRFKKRTAKGQTITRITHLHEALDALPPDATALTHVANTVGMWRRITGRQLSRSAKFNTSTVVQSIMQIPLPEAYIRHLHGQGFSAFAAMFHPNTLAVRKQDAALRGVFGGGGEYMDRVAAQIEARVVRD